jgi:hypothetical protein
MTKTVLSGALIAFLVFFVVTQPQHSADIFQSGWHAIVNVAHGIGDFIARLS